MIGHLTGTVVHSDLKSILLDVHGVGYKVYTNTAALNEAEQLSLWTYLAVRENALDLYGFATKAELDFFELLLTVSGIGPKSASNILAVASLTSLRQAITTGETSYLTKVSGIGKKVAEKIVMELKDKLGESIDVETGEVTSHTSDVDALLALQSLGYSERDAREALKKAEGENVQAKVRSALKNLSK